MRTAYFLGAGASYSLRPYFPLSRDLTIEKLLDRRKYAQESYIAIENPERGPDVIDELRQAVTDGTVPAEVVAARLEDVLDRLPDAAGTGGLRDRVLFLVMKRLTLVGDHGSGPLSSLLRKAQRRRDLFLTTNYDTVLEWELGLIGTGFQWSPTDLSEPDGHYWIDYGVPVGLQPPLNQRDARAREILGDQWVSLPILKLHGSVSWSECRACGRCFLDPLYKDGAADSLAGWLECRECAGMRRPIFVPPVNGKDVGSHPVIRAIWARAEGELKKVDRMVFAGFSLDPSDAMVCGLLRKADGPHLQRVVVVDPDTDGAVFDRFSEVYGPKVEIRHESWADYLDQTRARTAS